MVFKEVTPSFAGDSQHFGGDDINKLTKLFNAVDISGTDIPDVNSTFKFRDGKLKLRNPANTFEYSIATGAIGANRTLNLPVLTGTDTAAVLALAQTLTNKTVPVDQNLIKDSTTNTQGDVLTYQTDRQKRLARGSNDQVLAVNSAGTDTAWTTLAKANLPAPTAYEDEANTFTSNQKFETFTEQKTMTIPSDPASTYVRMYCKAVDANNDGYFAKVKLNAAIVEVRIF